MRIAPIIAILLLIPPPAFAQLYIELGVGAAIANNPYHCINDYNMQAGDGSTCSDNPLGLIAAGYQLGDFAIHLEHKSSLVEKDRGLDVVFLKYRHTFK